MLINSIDDLDQLPPGTQLTYLHSQSGSTWLGLSPAEIDARISALLGAGYELPPPTVLPDIPDPEPQPQPLEAYKALLPTSLFQRIGEAAEVNTKITKHYADLGFSLLAQPWGAEATAAAIANFHAAYEFTAEDQAWITDWSAAHNLGISLPWGSNS